ncbi:fasciclin domain-containing protein [Kushneria phosphatilytica]|uniref:Fasciclin domain-containing protein n=1 Tax=Kushneria phosphatilytica TaxID=657387 RepID=A0A1S1NTV5_9GAMM|nr:fasciclin domain-containing protein [Kushneria phosphatilytica]OHV10571.1 hypothetical protein BH688_09285 [Kushneria phosphatilytica]QEL11855.1 fasciclin domain-containing protein [Kushneria phosphatilytica]
MIKRSITLTSLVLALSATSLSAQAASAGDASSPSLGQQQARHQQRHQSVRDQAQYDSLLQALKAKGDFSRLLDAFDRAGLTDLLSGDGPHTLFAPTDEAFAQMPEAQRQILNSDDTERLRKLLRYHLMPGLMPQEALGVVEHPQALTGQLKIQQQQGRATVNGADIAPSQIVTRNGIIHPINQVLMPYYEN